MEKLGETENVQLPIQKFNSIFILLGGGGAKKVQLLESKYCYFEVSSTASMLSKYGNADVDFNSEYG